MTRLGAIFTVICVLLIAVSLGAVGYLSYGFSPMQAAALALIALVVLAIGNMIAARRRDRSDAAAQITDQTRRLTEVAQQVTDVGRRLTALEGQVEASLNKERTIAEPLAIELSELGALVKQLADTVASHDAALQRTQAATPVSPAVERSAEPVARAATVTRPAEPSRDTKKMNTAAVLDDPAMVETVRQAIEAGRIDLYLQPIVTLPQRKVRYYEALSRLRTENGDIVTAADFLDYAEAAGAMTRIDNLALFRAVQVVRRLAMKNREVGIFCNIAGTTLSDPGFFPQLTEFIDANRSLPGTLVFEFAQATVQKLGPMEQESLASLAERGFRFSMDHVTDLRFEPRDLSQRGFRFVKVSAPVLLESLETPDGDIHPADLSDLLGRHGIELIASQIESDGTVVDLLDFDVRYGQGFLFSPPRPVRHEALREVSDRSRGLAPERPVGDDRLAGKATERPGGRPQGGLGQLAQGMVRRA
jgi:cyclic-di-GMP phosphodiesterase TipF (flagellum assembly factor)